MPKWLSMTGHALKVYWKSIFVMIYPLALLPVFLCDNSSEMRCLYCVLLIAGLWVTEALPLAVTSLIPMVLFPLMGILDSDKTSLCYLKETNMMFIGGLIIAIAVEHSNLHTRISLTVIKFVGCSPKRLNVGLIAVTTFVSMWISNTAATAMMIPIVEATLRALEEQGIGEMYESRKQVVLVTENDEDITSTIEIPKEPGEDDEGDDLRRPTKQTMCYFISTAYAASIGGIGCIIGTGTNLTFKGLYETLFPNSPGVEFTKWMMLNVPIMLLLMVFSTIWLQFWYLGLFRPNSADAKKIKIGSQGEEVAKKLITQKLVEMGPMSFHETCVGICFIMSILLWFFRKPTIIRGWAELITEHRVKDATAALIVCMLLFTLPAHYDFIHIFSKDATKIPKKPSPPLVPWRVVQRKMPWGLIFLLGGGFALAEASKDSGMSRMIADSLRDFTTLPRFSVMLIAGLLATFLTQFSSNVAVANVVLPVLAEMSVVAKLHPMMMMMPATLCCSFAYCLPVSTPPNAIAAAPCNMPSLDMLKVGLGMIVVNLTVLYAVFPFYGPLIWDFSTYPDWAGK